MVDFVLLKKGGESKMEWTHVLALIGGNAAIVLPLWLHLEAKMDEQSRRIEDLMRDFHGRLCAIEERGKK